MGLLDFFRRGAGPVEPGMNAPSSPSAAIQGPPGFGGGIGGGLGAMPGMSSTPQFGSSNPSLFGGPSAVPMFPQSQPSGPMSGFQREPFSPTSELRDAQAFNPPQHSQAIASDDMGRKISHLEDKMEIINEKLDLILRELRNLYEARRM